MTAQEDLPALDESRRRAFAEIASAHAGIELLLLHGSRARGDQRAESDWDFAYSATSPVDLAGLAKELADATSSEEIDVARLDGASGLLRFRAARDGIVLFERAPGAFERFWLDAVRFWLDAEPVLRPAYRDVLERLPR